MKKMYWISGVVAVVLLVISYFSYTYWQHGTPNYSLDQFHQAIHNHNQALASTYLDTDSVDNNIWSRYQTKVQTYAGSSVLSSAIVSSQKDQFSGLLKQAWGTTLSNGSDVNSTITSSVISALFDSKSPFADEGDGVVGKSFVFGSSTVATSTAYKFTAIFTKQSNRTWRITDIQGLEDLLLRNNADQYKVRDLTFIKEVVLTYLKDNNKLPAPNSWMSDLGNTQFLIKENVDANALNMAMQDPRAVYGDQYVYAVDDQQNPTKFILQAKLSPDSTSLASQSPYKGNVYGVSCDFPFFCVGTAMTTNQ